MTWELGVLIGFAIFLSFLYYFSLKNIREANHTAMESLLTDKKALHALLKEAQNRIHAATMHDYLALQGRESEQQNEPVRRNDAIEAEIANRTLYSADVGGGV
jgi:heme oxygenase